MNLIEKLANARADLKAATLKMSGENKFAGYRYYDLSDFLPTITKLEQKYKMLSVVRWSAEKATLTIYDAEGEQGNSIVFESPMSTAELKGCHAVQIWARLKHMSADICIWRHTKLSKRRLWT